MKLRKRLFQVLLVFFICLMMFLVFFREGLILDYIGIHLEFPFTKVVNVPEEYSTVDRNGNGLADPIDVVNAARKEVEQRTTYKSGYYKGGYPPIEEGVCTDVVWRGLFGADISIKDLIDMDIAENTNLYPRVKAKPDPNIDFRRVPNQDVFFSRFAQSLTKDLIKGDIENLKEWQPGDIVVFLDGFHHVGIVSDKRTKNGTPYFIHNTHPFAAEVKLSSLTTPIAGHYRWNY